MKTKQQALLKLKVENEEEKLQKHHGFELRTKSGYRLDEVVSALQKAIRRGQEESTRLLQCWKTVPSSRGTLETEGF